jgi:hypothetical protein
MSKSDKVDKKIKGKVEHLLRESKKLGSLYKGKGSKGFVFCYIERKCQFSIYYGVPLCELNFAEQIALLREFLEEYSGQLLNTERLIEYYNCLVNTDKMIKSRNIESIDNTEI